MHAVDKESCMNACGREESCHHVAGHSHQRSFLNEDSTIQN